MDVLHSGRWSLSGTSNGKKLYELRFAEAFAEYNGVAYCTPTVNGSTALTIAMRALGIGHGDEVLVPGLTWVACPASVIECGAMPILVDLDPDTLCMSADMARRMITERTKAMMIVHFNCALADLDAFVALSEETGIPLIEDCSQAHGAMWKGRRVGSFGKIGAFSLHNSKVLTAGEGGAAITDDAVLHEKMQQLRANGRRYRASPRPGRVELEWASDVLGWNGCLSEFQAAILLDRLGHLDQENEKREMNAGYLHKRMADIGDVRPLLRHPNVDRLTYFRFCMKFDLNRFGGAKIGQLRAALEAELDVPVLLAGGPLNESPLYDPLKALQLPKADRQRLSAMRFELPVAGEARHHWLALPHNVLMGPEKDIDDIADAVSKLKGVNWASLPADL